MAWEKKGMLGTFYALVKTDLLYSGDGMILCKGIKVFAVLFQ